MSSQSKCHFNRIYKKRRKETELHKWTSILLDENDLPNLFFAVANYEFNNLDATFMNNSK